MLKVHLRGGERDQMPADRSHLASHRARIFPRDSLDISTVDGLHHALDAADLRRELVRWLISVVTDEVRITLQPIAVRFRRDLRDVVEDFVNDVMIDLLADQGKVLRAWNPLLGMQLHGFVALITRRTIFRRFKGFRRNPWSSTPADATELHTLIDDGIAPMPSILADVEYRIQLDQVLSTLYSKLSERDWRLFTKLFIEQHSPAHVAADEKIEENSVHKWRSRFHARVRKLFGQTGINSLASPAAPADLAARVRSLRDPLLGNIKTHLEQFLPPLTEHQSEALLNRVLPPPGPATQAP